MNKELSQELGKKLQKKFPTLKPEDACHVTIMTLATLADFLRKQTTFSSARLLKYASESVGDFLKEKRGPDGA